MIYQWKEKERLLTEDAAKLFLTPLILWIYFNGLYMLFYFIAFYCLDMSLVYTLKCHPAKVKIMVLTRYRLGYFRTHGIAWGVRSPCYIENKGRYREPRGSFDSSPQILPKTYLRF